MRPTNSVTISGYISGPVVDLTKQGWTCCKTTLDCEGRFDVQIFANSTAARLLLEEFHKGDRIVVRGHLSMSPAKQFQIVVQHVAICEGNPVTTLENRPRLAEESA